MAAENPEMQTNAVGQERIPVARLAKSAQPPRSARYVRAMLLVIGVALAAVFGVALYLNPYNADGTPRTMATHTTLGLPPCNFVLMTGKPCPSCGMTTSFALLMHGDLGNSLRANAVGTLLAAFCLALIPWNLACAIRGRTYFVWSIETALTRLVVVFLVLLLVRWGIVLGWMWGKKIGLF